MVITILMQLKIFYLEVIYVVLFIFSCDRMLVYEYVNNGNLEQWLHGDVGPSSPLTWEIRMNIILGTAKGCKSNQFKIHICDIISFFLLLP